MRLNYETLDIHTFLFTRILHRLRYWRNIYLAMMKQLMYGRGKILLPSSHRLLLCQRLWSRRWTALWLSD